jgi:hypothetical protein
MPAACEQNVYLGDQSRPRQIERCRERSAPRDEERSAVASGAVQPTDCENGDATAFDRSVASDDFASRAMTWFWRKL